MNMIYVFKTTVQSQIFIEKLRPHLSKILPQSTWNFDLNDCDNILRIDSKENIVLKVINLLNTFNFDCEELE